MEKAKNKLITLSEDSSFDEPYSPSVRRNTNATNSRLGSRLGSASPNSRALPIGNYNVSPLERKELKMFKSPDLHTYKSEEQPSQP